MKYPRQQPSDKPLTAAHTPSSRLLHCRFAFMDYDRCLQALCSQDRASGFPVPCRSTRRMIGFKMSQCWTWSLELARSYSDIIPSTLIDAQSVLATEIWSPEDVYFCATAKTFLYSAGHTAEVEPLSTPHLPSPSTLELCSGHLGASVPSSHQWCTIQCAGMIWGIGVPAAQRHQEARSIISDHTAASLTRLLA